MPNGQSVGQLPGNNHADHYTITLSKSWKTTLKKLKAMSRECFEATIGC